MKPIVKLSVRAIGERNNHRHLMTVGSEAARELLGHDSGRLGLRRKHCADESDLHAFGTLDSTNLARFLSLAVGTVSATEPAPPATRNSVIPVFGLFLTWKEGCYCGRREVTAGNSSVH